MKTKQFIQSWKLVACIMLLVFSLQLFAQPGKGPRKKEQFKSEKIAFITHELNLTPEEAKVFWPVYDEFEKKQDEVIMADRCGARLQNIDYDKITDKEALELADKQIVHMQKMLDLKKVYHSKFKEILPPKKLLKLYEAEKKFRKHLLKELKQGHQRED